MRCGRLMFWCIAILFATPVLLAERTEKKTWEWTIEERASRRLDPSLAAARRAVALAEGQIDRNSDLNVVLGSHDPELLMPWELMDRLLAAFHFRDAAVREKYRRQWFTPSACSFLGRDAFSRLEVILQPWIAASREAETVQAKLKTAPAAERETLQDQWQRANDSICPLRADALSAARKTFGRVNFDRFLYEVVAPGAVVLTTPSSDSGSRAELETWVEGGCR